MPPSASDNKPTPAPAAPYVNPDVGSPVMNMVNSGGVKGQDSTIFSKQSNLGSGVSLLASGSDQTKKLMLGM